MKNKSIKAKIMWAICLLVAVSLTIVGIVVSFLMYRNSINSLEKTMTNTVEISAQLVEDNLSIYSAIAMDAGMTARFTDPEITLEEKQIFLDEKIKQYDFLSGDIADVKGQSIFNDINISDRVYFDNAMKGNVSVSEVILSKKLEVYNMIVAAPLWKDGVAGSSIEGVIYFNINVKKLSDITNQIKIGETGSANMIDSQGYTIAHGKYDLVTGRENIVENAKTDKELEEMAKIQVKMANGETGFEIYTYKGVAQLIAYAPVQTGQGWSVAVNAELGEFIKGTVIAIIVTLIMVILTIIIGVMISISLANSITKPIIKMQGVATKMAQGDFDVSIELDTTDEIGMLANSMKEMIQMTKGIVYDMDRGLGEISGGNFDIAPQVEYIGVYKGFENSMIKIIVELSEFISQIKSASEQVYGGSAQMAEGAQVLAEGATEQAVSLEKLSNDLKSIMAQVEQNTNDAKGASVLTQTASEGMGKCSSQMTHMIDAMSKISEYSNQIGEIIKTIEAMASQTNMLALNASIEAARAGAAGKGFTVVSDEVRNLAVQFSGAAKKISTLIGGSIGAVENGVTIADETAKSLYQVEADVNKVNELTIKIAEASMEQKYSIGNIDNGVSQITAVVETNSATSQESAATSEELNSQANLMNTMVDKFNLKKM